MRRIEREENQSPGQLLGFERYEKITVGVKRGMSTGIAAHHWAGLAMSKAAAPSITTTTQMRMAILIAAERNGRMWMEVSPCMEFTRRIPSLLLRHFLVVF
ncbi:MAG: hypothetical protein ABR987_00215 [Terracidiphilus sp.]|jgi:hypothetical protein